MIGFQKFVDIFEMLASLREYQYASLRVLQNFDSHVGNVLCAIGVVAQVRNHGHRVGTS
jgi:hypothetical protein